MSFTGRLALGLAAAAIASIVSLAVGTTQPATPPPLDVPARTMPVPTTVSPEMQALIAAPRSTTWNAPATAEEWRKLSAPSAGRGLPELRERFGVTSERLVIDGVTAYLVTPRTIPSPSIHLG